MKETSNPSPLLFAVIIVLAGSLSPFNGLDDGLHKTPLELSATMLLLVLAGLAGYLLLYTIHTGSGFDRSSKKNDINS